MDRTVEFLMVHDASYVLSADPPVDGPSSVHWRDANDSFCSGELELLRATKTKLDSIDEKLYYQVRDQLFPLSQSGAQGSNQIANRAGYKLYECLEATGVWKSLAAISTSIVFVDLCGGPGAFSQALFASCPAKMKLCGYGLTLLCSHNGAPNGWYPQLLASKKFVATFGIDGTGDIFKTENILSLASLLPTENVLLVVADGGFDVPFQQANFQEAISSRIVFSQWVAALRILRRTGCFVLKLFDTFTPLTRSILFLSSFFFERVHIVKPKHSRAVNSERYLVCLGFCGVPPRWMEYLTRLHQNKPLWDGENTIHAIINVEDCVFLECCSLMCKSIVQNQVEALTRILHSSLIQSQGTCEQSAPAS